MEVNKKVFFFVVMLVVLDGIIDVLMVGLFEGCVVGGFVCGVDDDLFVVLDLF